MLASYMFFSHFVQFLSVFAMQAKPAGEAATLLLYC
jgi:hypothetical protein